MQCPCVRRLFFLLTGNHRDLLGKLSNEGEELGLARNVFPQSFRDDHAILCLVVLEDAAQGALRSSEGGVQGMDVFLTATAGGLLGLLGAVADFQLTSLVVRA